MTPACCAFRLPERNMSSGIAALGRSTCSVLRWTHADYDLAYYLSKTPAERLATVRISRCGVYGHNRVTAQLQKSS